jgi:uncharacterized membrane protein YkvA (DUF1232 family)
MSAIGFLRRWARRLKRDALTLWFAWRDPRTPLTVKALCLGSLAYALSPVDLIPDFIPIIGYLDDAIVLRALMWLALRMLPPAVLQENSDRTQAWLDRHVHKPRIWIRAVVIALLLIWALMLFAVWAWWRAAAS